MHARVRGAFDAAFAKEGVANAHQIFGRHCACGEFCVLHWTRMKQKNSSRGVCFYYKKCDCHSPNLHLQLCVHFQRFDGRVHRVLCLFVTFATVGDCIQRLSYEIENGPVIAMIEPPKLVQESEDVLETQGSSFASTRNRAQCLDRIEVPRAQRIAWVIIDGLHKSHTQFGQEPLVPCVVGAGRTPVFAFLLFLTRA